MVTTIILFFIMLLVVVLVPIGFLLLKEEPPSPPNDECIDAIEPYIDGAVVKGTFEGATPDIWEVRIAEVLAILLIWRDISSSGINFMAQV
jgi:hypothetical protein